MKTTKTQKHKNNCKFVFVTFSICILISLSSITASAVDADFKATIDSVTPLDNVGTTCPADVIINVTITKVSGSELSCIGPVLGTVYDNGALLPTVDTQNISNMCLTLNNDSESFTLTVSNVSAGSHAFTFSITAIGFTDTNLNNNNATQAVTLCQNAKPDLTVTAVRTFYNRPSETPLMDFAAMGYPNINYTTCPMNVWIEADIKNQGVVDASNVNVSVYVDSKLIGSAIKNIPAGGSVLVDNIIWNLNSSIVYPVKGVHNITVRATHGADTNTGNNQLTTFNTTCNFNLTTVLDCSTGACSGLNLFDFNTTYQGMSSTINLTLNNSGGSIDNWTFMKLSFSNMFNSTTTLPADFFVSRISGTCNLTNNKNNSQGTCITPPGASEFMGITLSTNLTQTPGAYTGLVNITFTYDNLLNTQLRLANISTRINILNRTTIVAGNQNSSFKLCPCGGTLTSSNSTKNTVNVSITNISVAFSNLNCITPGTCGSITIGHSNFTYSLIASIPIPPQGDYNLSIISYLDPGFASGNYTGKYNITFAYADGTIAILTNNTLKLEIINATYISNMSNMNPFYFIVPGANIASPGTNATFNYTFNTTGLPYGLYDYSFTFTDFVCVNDPNIKINTSNNINYNSSFYIFNGTVRDIPITLHVSVNAKPCNYTGNMTIHFLTNDTHFPKCDLDVTQYNWPVKVIVINNTQLINTGNYPAMDFGQVSPEITSSRMWQINNSCGNTYNITYVKFEFEELILLNPPFTMFKNFTGFSLTGKCNLSNTNSGVIEGNCSIAPCSGENINITLHTSNALTLGHYEGIFDITRVYGDHPLHYSIIEKNIITNVSIISLTISGFVIKRNGTKIDNATVCLDLYSDGNCDENHTTNTAGYYAFENPPIGNHSIYVSKSGYTTKNYSNFKFDREYNLIINFSLCKKTDLIYGYVFNCNETIMLEHATVTLKYSNGSIYGTKITCPNGLFIFYNITNGNYTLEFSKRGYVKTSTSVFNYTGSVGLAFNESICEAGKIRGNVTDENTNLLSGAVVKLILPNGSYYKSITDVLGYYEFSNEIIEGVYNIEVTKPGYFTNTFNPVNYTSNDSEINIAVCKCESGNICGEYFNGGNEILPAGDNISSCDNDILNLGDYPIIGAKIGAKVGAKVGINVGALCGDDLVVSGMTATPANPFVSETVIINATVNLSKGNIISNLDNVNVSLFIDNIYENSKIINLTNIGEINVTFNWTAVSGERNISVVVDANDEIDEVNESNNGLIINLTVLSMQNQSNYSIFVSPSSSTQLLNSTFNITVIVNGTKLIGASFNLTFNSTILEALNITEGSFIRQCSNTTFNDPPQVINNTAGYVKFQDLCFNEGVNNVSGEGVIAVVTFRAKSHGTTALTLNNTNIFNATGDPSTRVSVQNGQVKVNTKPAANFTYIPEHPVTYKKVLFNASPSYDNEYIISYSWNFGDGSNATGITPEHNYTGSGEYNVTLTVTDNDNASNSITKLVYVNNTPPTAVISHPPEGYGTLAYTDILFIGNTSSDIDGTIVNYFWNFGNGNNATGNVTHYNYTVSGAYNVTLTVTDNEGAKNSTKITVYINNTPPVAVISSPANGYSASTYTNILFTGNTSYDIDGTITGYLWDFGDGSNATGNVATHNYTSSGIYNVTLTVTDNFGAVNSTKIYVNISNTPPVAVISSPADGYGTLTHTSISFNSSGSHDIDGNITSYFWNFGDGSNATGFFAVHNYTDNGTYNVTLTVTDDKGAKNYAGIQVTVNNIPPVAVISSPANGIIRLTYAQINFNASGSYDTDGTIIWYSWNFGDNSNATGINVMHNYTNNGTYAVTLIVTDNDGAVNLTTITAYINNTPPDANAGPDIAGYAQQNLTFNGSNSTDIDGNIVSYSWNFTDGTNASTKVAYHTYNSCGVYNVKLTVTDNDGAVDDDLTTVTVYLAGDVTHDNKVDVFDLAKLVVAWKKHAGDEKYNPDADFNGDGLVDWMDFMRLSINWDKTC